MNKVDQIPKTMTEAEVSSSGHPEDVVMTVVNGVLAKAELDQDLMNSAVYVHEVTEAKPARGCANSLIESPGVMIYPEEPWLVDRIPAANRQPCRLDQGQEYQEA